MEKQQEARRRESKTYPGGFGTSYPFARVSETDARWIVGEMQISILDVVSALSVKTGNI